ncbi:MAG: AAA family ATPase [Desulfurococcales archaeon]|nr:AAA family ATPase [Desulfurococcales archaeon]
MSRGDGKIIFGVETLDEVFPDVLIPGTMMLIAGHPGAGKTTFASSMCYKNASRGIPCLYISFIEDKDKFMNFMGRLGFDFRELEAEGLFKYLRLPILTEGSGLADLSSMIYEEAVRGKYRLVVVDSITSIISIFSRGSSGLRAVLQNFLGTLAKAIKGVMVTIAELPYTAVKLPIEDAEFVADIVIMMRHRVEKSKLVRIMEIRKVRGSPLHVAEMPFTIRKGEGIRVFLPPVFEGAEGLDLNLTLTPPCRILDKALKGHVQRGMITSVIIPVKARGIPLSFIPFIRTVIDEGLRASFISFKYVVDEALHYFMEELEYLGLDQIIPAVKASVVSYKAFNPTGYSLEELTHQLIDLIRESQPDILLLDGVDMFFTLFEDKLKSFAYLFNVLQYCKSSNVWAIMIYSDVDPHITSLLRNISDFVIEERYSEPSGKFSGELRPYDIVWKVGSRPYVIDFDTAMECIREAFKEVGEE